jgi:hypothetical protein
MQFSLYIIFSQNTKRRPYRLGNLGGWITIQLFKLFISKSESFNYKLLNL